MKFTLSKIKSYFNKDLKMIKKLLFTASSRGIAAGGTFLFNFILAKNLNIDSFGYFMLAYSILIGLSFFSRAGMPFAIMRFAGILFSENQIETIYYLRKKTFYISLIASLFFSLLLILFAQVISDIFFTGFDAKQMLIYFAFALPFYSFLLIQSSFLKAIKKPELAPFFEVGLTVFLTAVIVWLFSYSEIPVDSIDTTIIFLCSSVFVAILGHITLNKLMSKPLKTSTKAKDSSYKFDIKNFYKTLPDYSFSGITNYFFKFSPALVLGLYVTGFEIGLYSLANSISFLISFVLWVINTVYAPYFASAHANGDKKELSSLVKRSMIYMILIATPIFLMILLFPELILSYFGEGFSQAKTALVILAIAQMYNVLTGPIYFLLNVTGYEAYLRKIVFLTAITSIVASFVLIPIYGYMGAVYANAIGLTLQNSFAFYHSNKYLKLKLL